MAREQLKWVRAPQQGRSKKTLERILDAAERLLDQMAFEEITVARLAKEAKTSVGSFYGRFENKEALRHALHERYLRDAKATAETFLDPGRWQGVALRELIHALVVYVFEEETNRAGLRRMIVIAATTNADMQQRSVQLAGYTCERLALLLQARADEIVQTDIGRAVDVLHRLVFGIVDQNIIFGGSPTPGGIDSPELVKELTDACLAYLTTPRS